MARETLDRKLAQLEQNLATLSIMVQAATSSAILALLHQDVEAAAQIYRADLKVNQMRFRIEEDCMITIATQQPIMAKDLRLVASILEVVGELERMGDYAKGIAKIAMLLGPEPVVRPMQELSQMGEKVVSMLDRAVKAFLSRDTESALQIPCEDDQVDDLYVIIYRLLIETALQNTDSIDAANHIMWAAHNLERMADRVTNICERTIYIETGRMAEIDKTDDEVSEPGK